MLEGSWRWSTAIKVRLSSYLLDSRLTFDPDVDVDCKGSDKQSQFGGMEGTQARTVFVLHDISIISTGSVLQVLTET